MSTTNEDELSEVAGEVPAEVFLGLLPLLSGETPTATRPAEAAPAAAAGVKGGAEVEVERGERSAAVREEIPPPHS